MRRPRVPRVRVRLIAPAQLIDSTCPPAPDPAVTLRRIAAEALILQDRAEAVLTGIARGDELGVAAPSGGPLIRRFFALAEELPRGRDLGPRQQQLGADLRTILIHHAMQLSTALDFLAVSWRSEQMASRVAQLGGLGEPADVLESCYRELRESA